MIPNFDFIKEVGQISGIAKNQILTNHYNVWKNNQIYNTECDDVYAGEIISGNVTPQTTWFYCNNRLNAHSNGLLLNSRNPTYKTIVIILESPHDDEYTKYPNFINPALGTTGENLQNHFQNFMNAVGNFCPKIYNDNFRIILMNSIQYQCSLGLPLNGNKNRPNKVIRDMIFSALWKDVNNTYGTKDDFITRLYCYNPDIIINLCTVGLKVKKHGGNLNEDLVQPVITQNFSSKDLIVGYHPSGWELDSNRYVWPAGNKAGKIQF